MRMPAVVMPVEVHALRRAHRERGLERHAEREQRYEDQPMELAGHGDTLIAKAVAPLQPRQHYLTENPAESPNR
jgi:hypothetical protein